MASFIINDGQRVTYQGQVLLGDDTIELDLVDAESLVARGIMRPASDSSSDSSSDESDGLKDHLGDEG